MRKNTEGPATVCGHLSILNTNIILKAMAEGPNTKDSILSFDNVCVDIEEKRIITNVSGVAEKGEILAIMGPSGACRGCDWSQWCIPRDFQVT